MVVGKCMHGQIMRLQPCVRASIKPCICPIHWSGKANNCREANLLKLLHICCCVAAAGGAYHKHRMANYQEQKHMQQRVAQPKDHRPPRLGRTCHTKEIALTCVKLGWPPARPAIECCGRAKGIAGYG